MTSVPSAGFTSWVIPTVAPPLFACCCKLPKPFEAWLLIEPILVGLLREAGEAALFDDYRGFEERFIRDGQTGQEEAAWQTFIDHRNGPGTWGRCRPSHEHA